MSASAAFASDTPSTSSKRVFGARCTLKLLLRSIIGVSVMAAAPHSSNSSST